MQLRPAIFLLIAIALTTIPSSAYAQTVEATTSIVALNYYPNAAVNSMITVSFDATYSTNQKVWLVTAIGCDTNESNCSSVVFDGVDSSPFPCNSVNPFANSRSLVLGTCYLTVSTGGVDFFSFNLSFSKPGTYNLTALVQLNSPGNSTNIPGSRSVSQTMIVKVT